MDIYQLRSFLVLAEHLHFGRAAKALHVSQPALTKQIHRLETEFGTPLLERSRRATRLTAVGAQWLPQVQEVVARFDLAAQTIRLLGTGTIGRLRVGFGIHSLQKVPEVVARLRAEAPEIQLTLRDLSTAEQAAALEAGELDVGLMRTPIADTARYDVLPAIEDRLALVTPTTAAPPAKQRLRDCREAPFVSIARDRSPGFFNHVLRLCAGHGFHPRIVQEVYEFPTAIALVRAGMGVTVIPQSLWTAPLAGVNLHRIPDSRAAWTVGAVWRRHDPNPALAAFLRLLRTTI